MIERKEELLRRIANLESQLAQSRKKEMENHELNKRLKESEERFNRFFSNLGDAVFVTQIGGENRGRILECNQAAVEQTGFSREELLTMNIIQDLTVASTTSIITDHWEDELNEDKAIKITEKKRRKDGSEYWSEVIVTSFIFNDTKASLSINRDISQRKEAEEKLNIALKRATESDRLKSSFLQNVSHEIRTPMNGILGFVDFLENPNISADVIRDSVQLIRESADRMLNTLNDLMEISLLETGNLNINKSLFFLDDIFRKLNDSFQPKAQSKNLKLTFSKCVYIESIELNTDENKFFAILANLMRNALKYTHHGFIDVGCNLKNGYLEIYIKDSGIGIVKDNHKSIFDRFVQGDIENRAVYEGVGLGLSISKAYADLLGGKLWVESQEGEGSTFFLSLPLSNGIN